MPGIGEVCMSRFMFLLSMIAALGGCVTVSSISDAAPGEKAATVILYTSLHDWNCFGINMGLAQKDASGRWVRGKTIILKEMFDPQQTPSQIELPAGAYGISLVLAVISVIVLVAMTLLKPRQEAA